MCGVDGGYRVNLMKRKRGASRAVVAAVCAASVLLVSACRDNDGGGDPSPTPSPTPTVTPSPTPPATGAIGAAAQTANSSNFALQRAGTDSASNYATAETSQHRLTRDSLTP